VFASQQAGQNNSVLHADTDSGKDSAVESIYYRQRVRFMLQFWVSICPQIETKNSSESRMGNLNFCCVLTSGSDPDGPIFLFLRLGWAGSAIFGGLGKFPLKIPNLIIRSKKSHRVRSKSIRVKERSASYLLRVKSMLRLGRVGSGPISTD